MGMPTSSPFSAADATLGYLYQVQVALLWSLQRLKEKGASFAVSLETLDDVTFERTNGSPTDLLQTKHHLSKKAALSDASPDLWKSLRIWLEAAKVGAIAGGTALHLITTGKAPAGSAAHRLRVDSRDEVGALDLLIATARTSNSKANADAYKAFLSVSKPKQLEVIRNVVVHDGEPLSLDLQQSLRREVFWASERKHQESFLERLQGWWLGRVLKQLCGSAGQDRILAEEIEAQMSELREQFKLEALPIDDDLLKFSLDQAAERAHTDSLFVRQVELVKAGRPRLVAAIRDYYRAFKQRSRWEREDLVLVGELEKYERRLREEWELAFARVCDELGADAAEDLKERAGREVLAWAETAPVAIRPNVTEGFVSRGSLHMLADDKRESHRIGWHPEFKARLAATLSSKGSGA